MMVRQRPFKRFLKTRFRRTLRRSAPSDDQEPARPGLALRVHEITDKTVVIDLNHPLAAKTLNFDVKVTDIKVAEAR